MVAAVTRAGDTVVEAGANMGYYTVQLSKIVGQAGRVIAFEPENANFSLLQYNVSANRVNNVDLRRLAVGARPERLLLQRTPPTLLDTRSDQPTYRTLLTRLK